MVSANQDDLELLQLNQPSQQQVSAQRLEPFTD